MKDAKKIKSWMDKKLESPKFKAAFEEEREKLSIGEQLVRDRRVVVEERLLAAQLGRGGRARDRALRPGGEQEHDDVDRHQAVSDPRRPANGIDVVNRQHHGSRFAHRPRPRSVT